MKKLLLMLLCLVASLGAWADNYLPGSWNEWSTSDESMKFVDGKLTLSLEASTTYEFKIYDTGMDGTASKWYGNNGTMVVGNCKGWNFETDANCKITTTTAGNYEFTINWNGSTPQISVFYPNETVKMYSSTGNAYAGADGNTGSRWESAQTDNEWWMIDYGTAKNFNTIKINWEGAYSKAFTLEGSNNGTDWDVLYTETNQTSAGIHTYDMGETVNYRYVKVNITERATGYGNSFYEFETYVVEEDVLTTLDFSAASTIAKVGESVTLTTATKNQYGLPMVADVTYTVSPAEAGHVANGLYYADAFGNATVTAQAGSLNKSVTIFNHVNDNVALSKTVTAETGTIGDASCLVDGNTGGSKWDCSNTSDKPWDGTDKAHQSWALIDLGDRYDIELVNLYFDGACSHGYGIWYSMDGENFTEAYTYARNCGENHNHKDFLFPGVVKAGVTDHGAAATNVRYIKYINTEMGNYGARLYEIEVYGALNQSAVVDVTGVTLNKTTATIAEGQQETLVATIAPAEATNQAVTWTSSATNIASVDGNGVVTAVYPGEATITVTTADGDLTASCVVTVTADHTKPHTTAPVPTKDAENVIALYSNAYTCVNVTSKNAWGPGGGQFIPVSEETVLGDNYLLYEITNTGMNNGIQFASQNLTDYGYMHIDIWSEVDGTLNLTLKDANLPTATLVAQQWNSFDFPLSAAGLNESNIADVAHIKINQASAELKDHKIAVDNIYFWKTATGYETISIAAACTDGETCYSTYSNESAFVVPAELTVSEISVTNGVLHVESYETGDVVPANTGVMVSAAEGGDYTITLSNAVGTSVLGNNNALRPSGNGITAEAMAEADADSEFFRLTMHHMEDESLKIGFWWGAENGAAFNLVANKAYLAIGTNNLGLDSSSNTRGLWFGEEFTTSINAIEKTTNNVIYNLQGQRINSLQKGVNIVNGKKIVR